MTPAKIHTHARAVVAAIDAALEAQRQHNVADYQSRRDAAQSARAKAVDKARRGLAAMLFGAPAETVTGHLVEAANAYEDAAE